jgi:hypothetical protein
VDSLSDDCDEFDWEGGLDTNCMNTLFSRNVGENMGLIRCNKAEAGPSATEFQLKMTLPMPLEYMNHIVPTQSELNSAMESMKCKGDKSFTKKCDHFDYGRLEEQVLEMDEEFQVGAMPQFYKSLFESHSEASSEEEDDSVNVYDDYRVSGRKDIQEASADYPPIFEDEQMCSTPDIPRTESLPSQIVMDQPSYMSSEQSFEMIPVAELGLHSSSPDEPKPAKDLTASRNESQFGPTGSYAMPRSIDARRTQANQPFDNHNNYDHSWNAGRGSLHGSHTNNPDNFLSDARHGLERIANKGFQNSSTTRGSQMRNLDSSSGFSPRATKRNEPNNKATQEANLHWSKRNDDLEQPQPSFDEGRLIPRAGRQRVLALNNKGREDESKTPKGIQVPISPLSEKPRAETSTSGRPGASPSIEWIPAKREQLDLVDQEYPSFDERETPIGGMIPSNQTPAKTDCLDEYDISDPLRNGIPMSVDCGMKDSERELPTVYSDLTSDGDGFGNTKEPPVIQNLPQADGKRGQKDQITNEESRNSLPLETTRSYAGRKTIDQVSQGDEMMGFKSGEARNIDGEISKNVEDGGRQENLSVFTDPATERKDFVEEGDELMGKVSPSELHKDEKHSEGDEIMSSSPEYDTEEKARDSEQSASDKTPENQTLSISSPRPSLTSDDKLDQDAKGGTSRSRIEPVAEAPSQKEETPDVDDEFPPKAASPQIDEKRRINASDKSSSPCETPGGPVRNEAHADNIIESHRQGSVCEPVSQNQVVDEKEEPSSPVHEVDANTVEGKDRTHSIISQYTTPFDTALTRGGEKTTVAASNEQGSESEHVVSTGSVRSITEEFVEPRGVSNDLNSEDTPVSCPSRSESTPVHEDEELDQDIDDQTFESADEHDYVPEDGPLAAVEKVEDEHGLLTSLEDSSTPVTSLGGVQGKTEVDRSVGELLSIYTIQTFNRYCKKLTDWDENGKIESTNEDQAQNSDGGALPPEDVGCDTSEQVTSASELFESNGDEKYVGMISQIDAEQEEVEIRYIDEQMEPLTIAPTASTMEPLLKIAPTATTMDTHLTTAPTGCTMDTPQASDPMMRSFEDSGRDIYARLGGRSIVCREDDSFADLRHLVDRNDRLGYETREGSHLDNYQPIGVKSSLTLPSKTRRKSRNKTQYHLLIIQGLTQGLMTAVFICVSWFRHFTGLQSSRRGLKDLSGVQCAPKSRKWNLTNVTRGELIQARSLSPHRMSPTGRQLDEAGTMVEFAIPDIHTLDAHGRSSLWTISAATPTTSPGAPKPAIWSNAYTRIRKAIAGSDTSKHSTRGWKA